MGISAKGKFLKERGEPEEEEEDDGKGDRSKARKPFRRGHRGNEDEASQLA